MKTMKTDFDEFDGGYSAGLNCNVAAAMIGSAVIGGAVSASSAKSAAKGQENAAKAASEATLQATRETNALQMQMYQQNLQNQSPYLKSGQAAQAAILGGMGLANPYTGGGSAPTFVNGSGQTVDASGNPVGAGAVDPVTGIATPNVQNYGATNAEMTQAYNQYAGPDGKGQFTQTFKPSDIYTDPSYQWRLQQGLQALKASQAATGTLQTGQGLKDINDYAQGQASTEYAAGYNRFMNNQTTLYNRLAGLAGTGQTTANNLGTAGSSAAGTIGSNTMAGVGAANGYATSGAAAAAAGKVGAANAIGGAVNSGINGWMTLQYMNGGANGGGAGGSAGVAPPANPYYGGGGGSMSAGGGLDYTG